VHTENVHAAVCARQWLAAIAGKAVLSESGGVSLTRVVVWVPLITTFVVDEMVIAWVHDCRQHPHIVYANNHLQSM
jgi:hypothetical protein